MKTQAYNLAILLIPLTLFLLINLPKICQSAPITDKTTNTSLSIQQRNDVKNIIKQYLLENPHVIMNSIQNLRKHQENKAKERNLKRLINYRDLILNDPTSPIAGNPKGDVTVVEFFDYSCGYCKRILPILKQLISKDKNIRLVFKELPILSPGSELAARAALASWRQDKTKYLEIHSEFMKLKGRFSEVRILRVANNKGLNIVQLKTDMNSSTLDKIITSNRQLAQNLNITGTPAFIIGDNIIPGAVDLETLKKIITNVRRTNDTN